MDKNAVKRQILENEAMVKELKLRISHGVDTVKKRAKWQRDVRRLERLNRELRRSLSL